MQDNFLQAAGSGGTLVHRLDPRTKLALLLASFIMAILPEAPAVAGLLACLVLVHPVVDGVSFHLHDFFELALDIVHDAAHVITLESLASLVLELSQ